MEIVTHTSRALVVEDDRSWQQILAEILADAGLAVATAASLEAALPLITDRPHRLALVDLSLGGSDHHNQDGLRVLQVLSQHDPGCATLLITGFAISYGSPIWFDVLNQLLNINLRGSGSKPTSSANASTENSP